MACACVDQSVWVITLALAELVYVYSISCLLPSDSPVVVEMSLPAPLSCCVVQVCSCSGVYTPPSVFSNCSNYLVSSLPHTYLSYHLPSLSPSPFLCKRPPVHIPTLLPHLTPLPAQTSLLPQPTPHSTPSPHLTPPPAHTSLHPQPTPHSTPSTHLTSPPLHTPYSTHTLVHRAWSAHLHPRCVSPSPTTSLRCTRALVLESHRRQRKQSLTC